MKQKIPYSTFHLEVELANAFSAGLVPFQVRSISIEAEEVILVQLKSKIITTSMPWSWYGLTLRDQTT